jgi:hypothetical protein
MAKYVFAYHGGSIPETEEEQQQVMAAWGAWFEAIGPSIVDMGAPLSHTRIISVGGNVTEGGDNPLTGYTIVSADSIDAALELAMGCPIRNDGGTLEVAECVEM